MRFFKYEKGYLRGWNFLPRDFDHNIWIMERGYKDGMMDGAEGTTARWDEACETIAVSTEEMRFYRQEGINAVFR